MECDYKLVENEGLFQEYLEMGENLPVKSLSSTATNSPLHFLLMFSWVKTEPWKCFAENLET